MRVLHNGQKAELLEFLNCGRWVLLRFDDGNCADVPLDSIKGLEVQTQNNTMAILPINVQNLDFSSNQSLSLKAKLESLKAQLKEHLDRGINTKHGEGAIGAMVKEAQIHAKIEILNQLISEGEK